MLEKKIHDPYHVIRNLMPAETSLAFVFDTGQTLEDPKYVFYVENGWRVVEAYFDGKTLGRPGFNAMDDDGLEDVREQIRKNGGALTTGMVEEARSKLKIQNVTGTTPQQMFENQFRPVTATDALVINLISTHKPENNDKIAIGIDVVIWKSWKNKGIFHRRDWDFGDELTSLFRDYPMLERSGRGILLVPDNIKTCFEEMVSILEDAPRNQVTRKIMGETWLSFQNTLKPCEYHPDLASLYVNICEKSREFMES